MPRLLPLALFVLVGCGDESKEAVDRQGAADDRVRLAGRAVRVDGIAMSWSGDEVHVGDSWEAAQRLFPERRGAYRLRTLPERFGRDFEAHGWETNEGQGFGVVTHEDLVVAAIYHADGMEADEAARIFEAQRAGTGTLAMSEARQGSLQWSYWTNAGQRLMVLRDVGKGRTDVTVLMGDGSVLDALGAPVPSAASTPVGPVLPTP